MSTKLTTSPDTTPCADRERAAAAPSETMADSRLLQLFQACRKLQERLTEVLVERLRARGYMRITASHLLFLAQLECGENHAAELARQTGISRQAVHKQVKELAALGLLEERQNPERRNQRTIVFTARGSQLIAECRAILAQLDGLLPSDAAGTTPDGVLAFLGQAARRLPADEE